MNYKVSDVLIYSNEFFKMIKNNDTYYEMLKNRYINVGKENILSTINELSDYYVTISDSLNTNSLKWYNGTGIYDKNMNFLIDFLNNRIEVFDKEFINE